MLTQVVLQTSNPMTFNIEGVNPDDILIIKSISGLTSTAPTLFTGDFARDGGYYQGRRSGKRNVVITFKMNPDYANNIEVSDIRELVYRAFHEPSPTSDGVKVLLKDDRKPDRYFIGYTETIDSSQFEKSQTIMVSMVVTDAYLRSDALVSQFVDTTATTIAYNGSADTGIEMFLRFNYNTQYFNVLINGERMFMYRASGFTAGHVLTINTNFGSRRVRVQSSDIAGSLGVGSKFQQLTQPNNSFQSYALSPGDNGLSLTSYNYRSAWWGI